MPLYEYACEACGHQFDVRHGVDEKPALTCPTCEGAVRKIFHAAGIIFKGSGWYVTDSAPKRPAETETPKVPDPPAPAPTA
jgi:putative FmdB family regulatory protein